MIKNRNPTIKWYTEIEYINIETGEVTKKIDKKYIIKVENESTKTNINNGIGVKKIRKEYRILAEELEMFD